MTGKADYSYSLSGCRPAASILNVSSMSCSRCPFPFCVITEARVMNVELRKRLTGTMQELGNSVKEIAKALDRNIRTVQRYANAHEGRGCTWCDIIHSQYVMCKSDIYSVVFKDGQYVVILNRHRHATEQELKVVEDFTEYVFPSTTVERVNGGHDHWVLERVELEEAKNFQRMCDALSSYALGLDRSRKCLQP